MSLFVYSAFIGQFIVGQSTIAVTGWAHCQRQVAFFKERNTLLRASTDILTAPHILHAIHISHY